MKAIMMKNKNVPISEGH
jgi:DNA-binding transcriptional regulator PaaX